MAKRTAKGVWDELVAEAGEDEIERAASISVEQAEKELAAAGFDVAAERAATAAFLDDLESGAGAARSQRADPNENAGAARSQRADPNENAGAGSTAPKTDVASRSDIASGMRERALATVNVPHERRTRRRWPSTASWFASAASLAVGLGVGATYGSLSNVGSGWVTSPQGPDAAALRRDALNACDAQKWAECLARLDRAREVDPAGDGEEAIRSARERALVAILGAKTKAP
jgi:hypothetical protein